MTPVNEIIQKLWQLDHLDAHLIAFLEEMQQKEKDLLKVTFDAGYKKALRRHNPRLGFNLKAEDLFITIDHAI